MLNYLLSSYPNDTMLIVVYRLFYTTDNGFGGTENKFDLVQPLYLKNWMTNIMELKTS